LGLEHCVRRTSELFIALVGWCVQAKLIDVSISDDAVDAALEQGEQAEAEVSDGAKKSKKQRKENREQEAKLNQQAEEDGNPQEAFSSQKRFLDKRAAGTSSNLRKGERTA
jgi:hypothetical protein